MSCTAARAVDAGQPRAGQSEGAQGARPRIQVMAPERSRECRLPPSMTSVTSIVMPGVMHAPRNCARAPPD